ncbi:MraY family glycosyltransferase [Magnetococcus sp. PR-3]|uniref:MraY family glycosyltransferase n=1 Tax=Magnetococcus sp. PR-3 TaxID=3120355 RepID=UPI002FCE66D3
MIALLAAAITTLLLLELLRRVAVPMELVDHPDTKRKFHDVATPVVGGLAIFCGWAAGWWMLIDGPIPRAEAALFIGMGVLALMGVMDDRYDLSVRFRLTAQVVVALMLDLWGGVGLDHFGDLFGLGVIELAPFGTLFTVICVVGVINALNMIDGMDGVCGSVTLAAMVVMALLCQLSGYTQVGALAWLFVACLVPFLLFNLRVPGRPRAKLFLGDAGSMVLGYALAWFAMVITQAPSSTTSPAVVLWVVLIPLFDLFGSVFRRALDGSGPLDGDRRHLHHLMAAMGVPVAWVAPLMAGVGILAGGMAILYTYLEMLGPFPFFLIVLLFLFYLRFIRRFWRRHSL